MELIIEDDPTDAPVLPTEGTNLPIQGTPLGGTELILAHLKTALPDLTDQVQLIMSRPQQVALDPSKPKVLWLQDLPHDPASQCLRDASYRSQFNRIVFCSSWQQQQYHMFLGIPYQDGTVIKNGVPHMAPTFPKPKTDGKLRFLYTSTPHRGLAILAAAAEQLARQRQDWELHVYSSLNIYGWHEQDKSFAPLYDKLRENPCVVYHGTQPNDVVRQACLDGHVWVYPSIYAETSCMAAQEAMMAGCLAIVTNYGALIETCGEWAWSFQTDERPEVLMARTVNTMNAALENYDRADLQHVLTLQSYYYQSFWSFESRLKSWSNLLNAVIAEGPREEMVVVNG
jgi:UDP-glucose:(glucosyl)LPS alpha-1,2-glucosyltransferase